MYDLGITVKLGKSCNWTVYGAISIRSRLFRKGCVKRDQERERKIEFLGKRRFVLIGLTRNIARANASRVIVSG